MYTPDCYAIEIGVEIFEFLNGRVDVRVRANGWDRDFGLPVAVWHPMIYTQNLVVEVCSDGSELLFRIASGPRSEFDELIDVIRDFVTTQYR